MDEIETNGSESNLETLVQVKFFKVKLFRTTISMILQAYQLLRYSHYWDVFMIAVPAVEGDVDLIVEKYRVRSDRWSKKRG